NKSQGKKINEYKDLMTEAFESAYWLLKPGRWMTIEFSNTKADVWNAIQDSIQKAGFVIANVSALNKGQGTFNSQTNPTSVKQDLAISAYKPLTEDIIEIKENNGNELSTWLFIDQHLKNLPVLGSFGDEMEYI